MPVYSEVIHPDDWITACQMIGKMADEKTRHGRLGKLDAAGLQALPNPSRCPRRRQGRAKISRLVTCKECSQTQTGPASHPSIHRLT